MPFFESFEHSVDQANAAIRSAFGDAAELGSLLKSSQNRTYKGSLTTDGAPAIFRVTPFTEAKAKQIALEYEFLFYLKAEGLSCCAPILPTICESPHLRSGAGKQWVQYSDSESKKELIICAFEFAAEGSPVSFIQYKWITEADQVAALGKWFGTFHTLSQKFVLEKHPKMLMTSSFSTKTASNAEVQFPVNTYATNLSGTLQGVPIDELDRSQMTNIHNYGLLHGDVNVSNFFTRNEGKGSFLEPIMFDFDQMQLGWYAFDLSQPFWGIVVATDANYGGSELPESITPTTFGDFGKTLIQAYQETFYHVTEAEEEATSEEGSSSNRKFKLSKPTGGFDWAQLRRMIKLRRMQYKNFCTHAVVELEGDNTPASAMMKEFCNFINDYISKEGNEERIDALLQQLQ